jgi:hypothetical protein
MEKDSPSTGAVVRTGEGGALTGSCSSVMRAFEHPASKMRIRDKLNINGCFIIILFIIPSTIYKPKMMPGGCVNLVPFRDFRIYRWLIPISNPCPT